MIKIGSLLTLLLLTPLISFADCQTVFSEDLGPLDFGPKVLHLQWVLNDSPDTRIAVSGPGSPGQETGYFGLKTRDAVIRFQEKYAADILAPVGASRGTGFVGAQTRAKLNELCLDGMGLVSEFSAVVDPVSPPVPNRLVAMFLGSGGFWSFVLAVFLVFGFNLIFWGSIGLIRVGTGWFKHWHLATFRAKGPGPVQTIGAGEVAVLIPAHNEELVITDTLNSLAGLVEPKNIYVVSDGSVDKTAEIARSHGAKVLELNPGKGKAGALETVIKHFEIVKNYRAVLLVDADTRLCHDYLVKALPFFNDPEVVAVAGYASTIWRPQGLSWRQLLFISHRDRVYFLTQNFVKFGQTWKHTNVTPIVPGFASIYRTTILDKLEINPQGIVIEDFNMTFEVHHKKLGKVAHHPSIIAYTQDPDNLRDYFRQIKRWHLGFWQTIRLHGFWPSAFWVAMSITLLEVISGSLVFLLLPLLIIFALLPFPTWQPLILTFSIGVVLADYLLTIVAAIVQRRPQYLLVGLLFPLVRLLDAVAFLGAIPKAFLVKSTGRWISPTRRVNSASV